MKVVMTLLVRDSDDLVRANLDFHLGIGVDHVIVMDNRSVDSTREILREYEARGVVTYLYQDEDDFSQARWVTGMARLAYESGADWVINNDADEFWYPADLELKRTLGAVPREYEAVEVERLHFVPRDLPPDAFFAEEMTVRYADLRDPRGNRWIGKVCHRARPDIHVGYGNHTASAAGKPLPATTAALEILHFPIRSYGKFETTVISGGRANERNPDRPAQRWQELYERWKRGELRSYFDSLVPGADAIADGLRDGRFVIDERLKGVFARDV